MTISLRGLSAEVAEAVARLRETFEVVAVSQQFRPGGPRSRIIWVHVEVRL